MRTGGSHRQPVPGPAHIGAGDKDDSVCVSHSLEYIREIAGYRTVPVEVGSRYTDEDWSQTLMTVRDFISKYIESEVCTPCGCLSPLPSRAGERRCCGGRVHRTPSLHICPQ